MAEPGTQRTSVLVAIGSGLAVVLVVLVAVGTRDQERATPDPAVNRPAASSSGRPSQPASPIPDDFPLLAGYPTHRAESAGGGREGPNRTLEPIVLEACGQRVEPGTEVDLLRGAWTDVEDFRERQLTTYTDAATAQAYVAAIVTAYRDCPVEQTSDGFTLVNRLLPSELGETGAVVATRYELDGHPAIGHTLVQVVRVGTAVLLAASSNEGGGGPDVERQLRQAADEGGFEIEDVVAAMCRFATAGC